MKPMNAFLAALVLASSVSMSASMAQTTTTPPVATDGPGQLCTSRNLPGVGLRGEYFAAPNTKGKLLLSRMDLQVDFDAALLWPAELQKTPPKSVRWTGWIRVPLGGLYVFHLPEGQQGEIRVANEVALTTDGQSKKIELIAGRFSPIAVTLPTLAAGKPVKLEWTAPHGLRYTVPRGLLYPPTDQAK
jgi:PA14 domain